MGAKHGIRYGDNRKTWFMGNDRETDVVRLIALIILFGSVGCAENVSNDALYDRHEKIVARIDACKALGGTITYKGPSSIAATGLLSRIRGHEIPRSAFSSDYLCVR